MSGIVLQSGMMKSVAAGGGGGESPGITNLVSWWAFDEVGPNPVTWADSHGSFDLTSAGITPLSATGHINGGMDLDDNGDEFVYNTDFSNTIHLSDFTAGGWFKADDFTEGQGILGQFDGGSGSGRRQWLLRRTDSDDTFRFILTNTSGTQFQAVSDSGDAATTDWVFVVGRRSGDTIEVFVNGVSNGTTDTFSGTEQGDDTDLRFGRFSATYSDAFYDESFVYSRALTDAEILWLYNDGAGRTYGDL